MRLLRCPLAVLCLGIAAPAVIGTSSTARASHREPDAKAILGEAGLAMAKIQALSYDAAARAEGPLATGTPVHTTSVSMVRAEAGGWKVGLTGSVQSAGQGAKAPTSLTLGYDGATAWALREVDKVAYSESSRSDADVERFFRRNSAGPGVLWEIMDDKALAAQATGATLDAPGSAAGVECHVVKLGGEKDEEGNSVSKRLFIAKGDHLPRRVERIREVKDVDGTVKTLVRATEITNLKLDDAAATGTFTLSVPEGYTIRTGTTRERANPLSGPSAKDKPAAGSDAKPGSPATEAPDFTLKDPDGREVTLSKLKGSVVVLDFWATWCKPCTMAMPSVQRTWEKYKDKGVLVFGVNCWEEDPQKAVDYKHEKKYTYALLLRGDDAAKRYGLSGIPAFFVIGKDGKVVERISGFGPTLESQLGKAIDKALASEEPKPGEPRKDGAMKDEPKK